MRENISPRLAVSLIAVLLIILGIYAYNAFKPKPKADASQFKFTSDNNMAKKQAADEWFKNHPGAGGAPASQ